MSRFRRYMCLLLVVAIMMATPVFASENAEVRGSAFFARCSVYLDEITTYTFRACFDVTALRTMDVLGASEIRIQRSSDGETWTTMKTFTKEEYTHLVDEDQLTHMAYVTYTGARGYYYRAKVTLYAKDSTGIAEAIVNTSKIKIGG